MKLFNTNPNSQMGLLAALLSVCSAAAVASTAAASPHIVFMVIDDLGWNDLGYHSSANGSDVRSPNIDALARGGVTLSDYNVFRFCSPSRSTFQTGRYPYHVGQQTGMNLNPMPGIACGINNNYDFIPKMLQRKGYKSYALGKWHLGFYNASQTPTYRGYSEYFGYYSGAEEHFTHEKAGFGTNHFDLANNTGANGAISPASKSEVGPNGIYSVYLYGNESIRYIRNHDPSTPMFMYLAWNVVHNPCEAPKEYIDQNSHIASKTRRTFAGMVSALDDAVPQVINALKEKTMWNQTVLIVSTDNGGNLGGSGNNWPLRGGKFTFWQGGVRGIAFVHSPLLPSEVEGKEWGGMMHAVDWYTTIAEIAGADTADTGPAPVDGLRMWGAIRSLGPSPRTEMVINIDSSSGGFTCLRQHQWKLIDGYPGNGKSNWDGWVALPNASTAALPLYDEVSDAEALAMPYLTGESPLHGEANRPCSMSACLFDVAADPEERQDVAAAHPDVVAAMRARVAQLRGSEVSMEASGLCPFDTGSDSDPKCGKKAKEAGFWLPWCDENFPCTPAGTPTPPPPPTPPTPPSPAPSSICTPAERALPPVAMSIVRADAVVQNATTLLAGKQAWEIVAAAAVVLGAAPGVHLRLKANSSLCLGVRGGTAKNPKHGQAVLVLCSSTDATQQWKKQNQSSVGGTFHLTQAGECLDLQMGNYVMERTKCNDGPNQIYTWDATTGHLAFAKDEKGEKKVVDVC